MGVDDGHKALPAIALAKLGYAKFKRFGQARHKALPAIALAELGYAKFKRFGQARQAGLHYLISTKFGEEPVI